MKSASCLLAGCLLLSTLADSPAAALELQTDTEVATAGYYQLRWQADDEALRLVESKDPGFPEYRIIYEGVDTARLVSGKPDGAYYYRLESVDPANTGRPAVLSNTVSVVVRHHPLARAVTFFGLGAAVFAATLALILFGNRSHDTARL